MTTSRSSERSEKRLLTEYDRDLAPGLKALLVKPPLEQAEFWQSCVSSQQKELQELGELPLDAVFNDVLTRYFDSSCQGIKHVYNASVRDQKNPETKLLEKDGMYDALSEHYCFFEIMEPQERDEMLKACSNEFFERICGAVGIPCDRESFAHAIRRLRLAVLLRHFNLHKEHAHGHESDGSRDYLSKVHIHGQVYHCDYDDDNIFTPFNASVCTKKMVHNNTVFNIPIVQPQIPISNLPEYLFVSKSARPGRVHWVHLQVPSTKMLLAVGQVWRLPGPDLSLLCDMKKAQPQISVDKSDGSADPFGYSWSSLVMPSMCLDPLSRESLLLYRNWFESAQDPSSCHQISPIPPRVRVAVTKMNITMLWSSPRAGTLLSVTGEASYIGKWNTDVRKHTAKSYFQSFVDAITCRGCCTRRRKEASPPAAAAREPQEDPEKGNATIQDNDPDEKTPLLKRSAKHNEAVVRMSKKGEAGVPISKELSRCFKEEDITSNVMGAKVQDPKQSNIQFEQIFERILQSLERQNSMLRLGNHMQLLVRIMSNMTSEYLDVLEVYEAGITRLKYLLRDKDTNNKDDLVAKIALAKLELNALVRLVKPFSDFVVSELHSVISTDEVCAEYPLISHHIKDVQNNVRTFLPKCDALIQTCRNLTDEYDRVGADKMNHILNILTFITFVITPAQLLTGLYGMNFRIIPELDWHHGYLYFWILSVSLSITFGLVLVCLKRN